MVIFLTSLACFSQKNESAVLLKKAGEVLYDNPAESIKICSHLLTSDSAEAKSRAAFLLAEAYLITGDYTRSLSFTELSISKSRESKDDKLLFESLMLSAEIHAHLTLLELAKKYRAEAEMIDPGNPRLKSYDVLVLNSTAGSENTAEAFITKGTKLQHQANLFALSKPKLAASYFEKNLAGQKCRGAYWEILAQLDYGDFLLESKNYQKTIALLNEAGSKEKQFANPFFEKRINHDLADAWLALGDKDKFMEFRAKAASADDRYDTQVENAVNLAFENLQNQKAEIISGSRKKARNTNCTLAIAGFSLLLLSLGARWFFKVRTRNLQDIINYLKLIKNVQRKAETAKPSAKNLSIPKETEDALLAKLEKFESGKRFLSKEISLAQVASAFETNTKYLSEVINKYKKKN
ncbi:MAG: hypothetical protein EOO48_12355, partial [Flavobacterium sp.]